ncbi:chromosome partition protein Smc [Psychrosphaera saromensis]|uniref:Chromosome partition protein Smc n=1 Tax=Psychrosphaera saromensis TaxID=716813 RepID=A0A2S7UY53_9GAMM|nr:chromosome segregation protein SMC [Psychrosphaera saromensis]PQJ54863.1 chromosome segregation protein SMC [Psychrosphaera saromensis]GHB56541.1 chromosome partition protein Smc [Psychrosphaera saromensis]GLQ13894.1 chromosome partition protein Smc [Psychrosphaera saromensis]
MRLKLIKLAGFKSFVDVTTVPFPDQMTAIVGPNGCGKSNVIDAVRWVLGESSAKNLRGDSMTDVIFNGSTNRKPVSLASVELVFDNSDGKLQGNFASRNEISIKRQVTKDAQSSYFLNGTKCRRRDITDIFLGTGLGPRSYAIIEQGMISRLIESKPQELRIFIEEAAGISKYKERRRETETRIKHTRENLLRLEDVRQELSVQIDKLQRQAATAKRFKQLKAKERQYKGELYALKWHKYNEQLNRFEKDRLEKETELEAFIAEQRGGELGMLQLKEQHQELSDQVQANQQSMYQVGNQITRVEQQIVFTQEKLLSQQDELQQLQDNLEQSETHSGFEQERLEELLEQKETFAPEVELVAEQIEQATETLLQSEEEYEKWQAGWQAQQRRAANSSQSSQVIQTKLQAIEQNISGFKQRLLNISAEIQSMDVLELEKLLEQNSQKITISQTDLAQLEQKEAEQNGIYQQAENDFLQVSDQQQEITQTSNNLSIKLQSLRQWQQEYESNAGQVDDADLNSQGIELVGDLLTQLNVQPQWQFAIETLLSHHGQSNVTNKLPIGTSGHFVSQSTEKAPVDSAAAVIKSGVYPDWLNQVAIAETEADAKVLLQTKRWSSVITKSGVWCGLNWQSAGSINNSGDVNVLQRLDEINQLQSQLDESEQLKLQMSQQVEDALAVKKQTLATLNQFKQQVTDAKSALLNLETEARLLKQQFQQAQTSLDKLTQDAEQQTLQIELEQEKILELELQLEVQQDQELELQSQLDQLEQEKQHKVNQLNNAKQSLDVLKNQSHQYALKAQTLDSQYESVQQNINRATQHQKQVKTKLQQITESLDSSSNPVEDLKAELEEYLLLRLESEERLLDKQNELALVAEKISQLEQGQSGIHKKLDSMRSEIESIKLDSEGARIRAQNMLETLKDIEQPLKPILESMPAEANEEEWQAELEKTTLAISRLGAINLAAIEEYDVQAERKGYLDEQHNDLFNALDTLENAIRKIDRESRARFKETYDKVNEGLQYLFPKVFGGGSAYLALTADDMLEAGVTIMARPPGKKNSTIHLLSGGEKALTALSLVFSIFRLNPAPFCMLDEVDAPLDDANVGRFCKLVKEMSDTVQFIFISHNKVAMEMATHLTGVTMQEPGVSRLVAVDIQDAVKMADAL